MNFKAAICPSCGGQLQVPDDRESVKCMYCGSDIVIREATKLVPGIDIKNYLELAKNAQKIGNFQEAYDYYSKILQVDIKNADAWFGKAITAGWMSTNKKSRLAEMGVGIRNAIDYAPDSRKEEFKIGSGNALNDISIGMFRLSEEDIKPKTGWLPTFEQYHKYLSELEIILRDLDYAYDLSPNNQKIIENIIYISKLGLKRRKIVGICKEGFPVGETKKLFETKLEKFLQIKKGLDPSYKPPDINIKTKSCCFVITATMGDRNHPYVLTLQDFRDSWLSKRSSGRTFNTYYYRYGPYLADIIRERKTLRFITLHLLVKPSVWIATNLMKNGEK